MAHEHTHLRQRLAQVVATDGGDPVEDLTIELERQQPKRIRGFLLEPGANGMRRQPCTWLPDGRHRLYPKLNLTIPVV